MIIEEMNRRIRDQKAVNPQTTKSYSFASGIMVFCIFPLVLLLLYYIACNHQNETMLLEKSSVIEQQQIVISEHEARTATLHATLNATNIALEAQSATLNATKIALESQKKITDQFKHSVSDLENVQRIFMGTKRALEMSRNQLSKCKEAGVWERDVIQSKDEELVLLKEQLNTVQAEAEVAAERHVMTEPQRDVVLLICVLFVIFLTIFAMMCCFCCKMKKENEKQRKDFEEQRGKMEKERNTQKKEWNLLLTKLEAFDEEQDVIDDKRTEMKKADAIIQQIHRKKQELSAEIEKKRCLWSKVNKENDDLSNQNEKQRKDLEQKNEEIKKIQEEREKMKKQRNIQKKQWELLLAKLEAFVEQQDVIDDKRTEMEKADAIIQKIRQKVQKLSAEIEQRAVADRDEDDEKVVEVDKVTPMNESDCPQCQRTKGVLVQYQQMIHQDAVESAEDVGSNDKMLHGIFNDLSHAQQKLCTNQGEIDDLKKENEKQREDLGRKKKEIKKMQEKRRKMEKERDTQKREKTSFLAKLAAVVDEEEVIDDERTETEKADAVILQMQQNREETKAHREKIKQLSSNLDKSRSDREKQRARIKTLGKQIEEQSASHGRLKRDLDTMKRERDESKQKLAAERKQRQDEKVKERTNQRINELAEKELREKQKRERKDEILKRILPTILERSDKAGEYVPYLLAEFYPETELRPGASPEEMVKALKKSFLIFHSDRTINKSLEEQVEAEAILLILIDAKEKLEKNM